MNIPTGVPLVYQFDEKWNPIPQEGRMSGMSGRYVGDLKAIAAEIEKVANQAKKNYYPFGIRTWPYTGRSPLWQTLMRFGFSHYYLEAGASRPHILRALNVPRS